MPRQKRRPSLQRLDNPRNLSSTPISKSLLGYRTEDHLWFTTISTNEKTATTDRTASPLPLVLATWLDLALTNKFAECRISSRSSLPVLRIKPTEVVRCRETPSIKQRGQITKRRKSILSHFRPTNRSPVALLPPVWDTSISTVDPNSRILNPSLILDSTFRSLGNATTGDGDVRLQHWNVRWIGRVQELPVFGQHGDSKPLER